MRTVLFVLLFSILTMVVGAQSGKNFFIPSDSLNKKRLTGVIVTEAVVYGGTMYMLNNLWYKDFPRSRFHFFNDNAEWQQMDKIGHATTAYYVGKAGFNVLRWAGVERKRAVWYGGSLGFFLQTTIETLDGFSEQWGASGGDILFNTIGTGMFIGQELAWQEQRVTMKFSFSRSGLEKYRPDLLGKTYNENLIKDYNGQTYWLSANIKSFIKKEDSGFPSWLNLAIGYGADGMTGGMVNASSYNGTAIPQFERFRQYYLSLDVDLSGIKTKSRFLNTVLGTIGFIKVPAPAVELNKPDGIKFHLIHF